MDKQKQASIRDEIQEKAVILSTEHDHILLEWATGCGKTLAALKIMQNHGGKWLIVCKETNHINNWKADIAKHGIDDSRIIDIICYASLHKFVGSSHDGINMILDEVHALSEMRENYVSDISPDKIISLSATIDTQVSKRLTEIKPFRTYRITTSEAIASGLLPEPKVYVVKLSLDNTKKDYVVKRGKYSKSVTALEMYQELTREMKYWKERYDFGKNAGEDWVYKKFMMRALVRKKWIAEYKTGAARFITQKIGERRHICFTGSIEQCALLGANHAVHSKISPKKREQIFNDFNEGRINSLYAVNMMREAMNIENIQAGMIIQLDGSSDRSFIQSLGRTLRGDNPEFFILCLEGTKDEDYLQTALEDFDKKYLKFVNYGKIDNHSDISTS